jgi:hypothetical protein
MKFKLWQWEYEFDREDAEIVVPLVLVVFGLAFTQLKKEWLLGGAAVYYLLYFFVPRLVRGVVNVFSKFRQWRNFRCPYCKSHNVFEQGYQEYHGDIPYMWHLCNHCGETSVLLNTGKLIKPGPGSAVKALKSRT